MKKALQQHGPGVALVIVLFFLAIVTIIVVAFISSVTTELAMAHVTAASATTQQLANSAVNVVMAQLVDGTKGRDGASLLAWTSQPGMVRTFDSAGQPGNFYKLYSSDRMVVAGAGFDAAGETPPSDWNSAANSDLYTDLNAPGTGGAGELVYPIVDPAADGTPPPNQPSDKFKVDGFRVDAAPGFVAGRPESFFNNRAAMPVRWLYVLKDGTLHPATAAGIGAVTVAGAAKDNPIVARLAFWTDDETGKVNINTAAEGTYWDVPRIYSDEDYGRYSGSSVSVPGMSICQPARFEYQRYPGHPATTCLSPVLGSLLGVTYPYPPNPSAADASALAPYYDLTPRIGVKTGGGGGSLGGTVQVVNNAALPPLRTDRLYASVDELMFTPAMTAGTSPSRIPNTTANGALPKLITKAILEKSSFFLTAHSTAPETTLYNTPRVAVWPVWEDPGKRTAYDALLAFCSTIGGQNYFFTRSNPRSGTADYTPRNAKLYQYLQAVSKTSEPGFGDTFQAKYAADTSQILTSIFDYIRSTNAQDQSKLPNNTTAPYTPLFTGSGTSAPAGEIVPIRIGGTQGFGRFYSITSANLLFYGTRATNGKIDKMRGVFFLGFTTPLQGLACMRSNLKFKVVKGLEALRIKPLTPPQTPRSLNFKMDSAKGNGVNYIDLSDLSLFHGRSVGGTESPWMAIRGKPFANPDAGGDASGKYPFFSASDVDVSGLGSFLFEAPGEITVEVRTKDTDAVLQTFHFQFPNGQFKVPTSLSASDPVMDIAGFGLRTAGEYSNLINSGDTVVSLQVAGANGSGPEPAADSTAGDIRMTASLVDVPASRFRADNSYTIKDVQFAHCLVQSVGEPFTGAKYGRLVNVADPAYKQVTSSGSSNIARQPDVPSRAASGVTRRGGGPGDWDTGFGDQKDGAYINKADEGDTSLQDPTNGRTRLPYSLGWGAGWSSATNTYFSPNRQIPSPLMLGSIPTGVQRLLPWQTLLFHPRPEDPAHPGNGSPRDHLLADWFWMPVVEPYAISQPFATAGKINLNYQIIPFSYLRRATGLHAVMKATKFAALPLSDAPTYKPLDANAYLLAPTNSNRRHSIDMDKTLADFDLKFKNNDVFRSASQICEMNLVPPEVASSAGMAAFWNGNKLTGDNLREKPYVDLYSRLTTKSNTYTVHVWVQTLVKSANTPADQWVQKKDRVIGEYRGSSILERYIDPNDPQLPDFAQLFPANPQDAALNIDQYYKMRVISTKRFNP